MLAASSAPIAPGTLLDGLEAQTTQATTHTWDMRRRDQCGAITAQPSRSFPPQDTPAQARSWRSTE
jgi:hypothetical protein